MRTWISWIAVAILLLGCQAKESGEQAATKKKEASASQSEKAGVASAEDDEKAARRRAAEEAPAATPGDDELKEDHFAAELFGGYVECYAKLEINGAVDGKLQGLVTPEGKVENVTYSGSAPKPAVQCMTDAAKAITLAEYNGEKGFAYLSWSGTVHGGTRMLSQEWEYRRFADLPPDERAAYETAPAGADDEAAKPADDSAPEGEPAPAEAP